MESANLIAVIKKEMNMKNISCKEIADKTGLSKRYIQYIQNGRYEDIKVKNADKILKVLEITVKIGV